jgi:hypothetical protein
MTAIIVDILIGAVCLCAAIIVVVLVNNFALPYLGGAWFIRRGDTVLGPFYSRRAGDRRFARRDRIEFRPGHLFRKTHREGTPDA